MSNFEPRLVGGLRRPDPLVAKHEPESVRPGDHGGPDGRHWHCSLPNCAQEHLTPRHAADHVGQAQAEENAEQGRPPVRAQHRAIDSGRYVPGPPVPAGGQEVQHFDLSGAPPADQVARAFNRPLLVRSRYVIN